MNEERSRHSSAVAYWESVVDRHIQDIMDRQPQGILDNTEDARKEKRGRAIDPIKAARVRRWMREHPGQWVKARDLEEDLGLNARYLGNVLKHLMASGDPVESYRTSEKNEEYRWMGS